MAWFTDKKGLTRRSTMTAIPLRFIAAGELGRWRGRFAPHHRAADYHPLSVPALRAWPSSGCSGQPSPQASYRVRQPLIRSTLALKPSVAANDGGCQPFTPTNARSIDHVPPP
jgi:hypothetical protein